MIDWLIFAGIVVIAVLIHRLRHRCVECRSVKTFNWTTETMDTHRHVYVKNRNQFCFHCNELTWRDDFGASYMWSTLRWKIAAYYHNKRLRDGEEPWRYSNPY